MVIGLEPDERQLISQLKKGDTDAAGALMDLHGEALMRYLYSIMGSRESAEDVFQDSWVKVMEKISLFDSSVSFRPWLFRVARNAAYDALRRKKRWWSLDTGQSVHRGGPPQGNTGSGGFRSSGSDTRDSEAPFRIAGADISRSAVPEIFPGSVL